MLPRADLLPHSTCSRSVCIGGGRRWGGSAWQHEASWWAHWMDGTRRATACAAPVLPRRQRLAWRGRRRHAAASFAARGRQGGSSTDACGRLAGRLWQVSPWPARRARHVSAQAAVPLSLSDRGSRRGRQRQSGGGTVGRRSGGAGLGRVGCRRGGNGIRTGDV